MIPISFELNGETVEREVDPRRLLVHLIRDDLDLTGTHIGCDTGNCGACTVLVDGEPVLSCLTLAAAVDGCDVLTVEGLARDGVLDPVQEAFLDHAALQCGFCTPGMVMNAIDFAKSHPNPSEQEIREALEGNLCRCTGYHNIVKAIGAGARAMAGK